MLIQYYLADGTDIKFDTGGNVVDMSMINDLAMLYAKARPNDLPTHIFMHVSLYSDFSKMMLSSNCMAVPGESGVLHLVVYTGCGPLIVIPQPWAFDKFLMLVGKQEDYDRYFLDEVFEATVLKDCERT